MASRGDINITEVQPILRNEWLKIKIDETIEKSGAFTKLKSKYYFETGAYPVVDQGDKFISGYVNDESLLYQGELPVIIFGDHTRNVKFIDFPFATGADGTKILKPKSFYNPKFYHYYFKSLRVPNLGYSRHFSILKEIEFPLPPLAEQNRIVAKLDSFFTQLETIKASMVNIPVLLKNFRQQVLMQAVTGKLLNVNQFTELGNLKIEIKTGPFGSALHKSDYIENGIPVINPSHIHNGSIIPDNNVTISKEYFKKLKAYKLFDNDVILGRRGEMGRAALYNEEYGDCLCGTGSIILRCGNNLYPKFLTYYLRSPFCIEYLNTNSVGSTMVNLNQKIIKSLRVPSISYSEQKEIVNRIESLFAKADAIEQQYKSLKGKIDTLPQALLHKAFKGELTEQLDSDGDARKLLKQIQELKGATTKVTKNTKLEKLKSFNKKTKNYSKSEDVLGMVAEGK